MNRRKGRPMKYRSFLAVLCDDQLYSPATIVHHGQKLGLFKPGLKDEALKLAKLRIRITLARLAKNHVFPEYGDGFVKLPGQAPVPGWLGKRWKAAMG